MIDEKKVIESLKNNELYQEALKLLQSEEDKQSVEQSVKNYIETLIRALAGAK